MQLCAGRRGAGREPVAHSALHTAHCVVGRGCGAASAPLCFAG